MDELGRSDVQLIVVLNVFEYDEMLALPSDNLALPRMRADLSGQLGYTQALDAHAVLVERLDGDALGHCVVGDDELISVFAALLASLLLRRCPHERERVRPRLLLLREVLRKPLHELPTEVGIHVEQRQRPHHVGVRNLADDLPILVHGVFLHC